MNHFKNLILDEYFEPALGRAVRVTLAFILPLVWGLTVGSMTAAVWIAISAQLLSNLDIQGSYPVKLLVMSGAIIACGFTGMLGTVIGGYWIGATFFMLLLAFMAGFVRQSGTHGPGITIGVLLLYLLCLDHPGNLVSAGEMFTWILCGGVIALVFTLISWIFIPFSPFRRSVSYTWKAMSDWLYLFSRTLTDSASTVSPVDELDEKELAFREELSHSTEILSRNQAIAHARQNRLSYQLVELRRIVSFANPAVSSLRDAIESVKRNKGFPEKLITYILENLSQSAHRIAVSIITNRREEVYAARLSLKRVKNNTELLRQDLPKTLSDISEHQLMQSLDELIGYLEEALAILEQISNKSGSMTFFMRNFFTGMTIPQKLPVVHFELNLHSFSFRFSLRLALAMGIGVAVYKIFHIPHGYWIAMTVMIILQPEFGATITKAIRRLKGTILGALIGSLIFIFPLPLSVSLAAVVLCSFIMTYYIQHNYAVAAFFITIMVIALYHLLEPVTWQLGLIRVLNTLAGAGLALLGGYAFFPLWERYLFPAILARAIQANKVYFETLLDQGRRRTNMDFVKPRREAEVTNSNAFQSLKRMKDEPHQKQANQQSNYIITGYNIRITRLLKTLNRQLVKQQETIDFPRAEAFKDLIGKILETTSNMAGQERLSHPEELPPPDEMIRQINGLLKTFPLSSVDADQMTIKNLLERIAKETIGLYYSVRQVTALQPKPAA